MPHTNGPNAETAKALLGSLTKLRETARLRLHLLSLEAKERLLQLESRVESLGTQLSGEVDNAVIGGVREVTDAIRSLLREYGGVSLSTNAGQLMRAVQPCAPSDNLSRAAQLMWELDCGFVPVCDRGGHLVGVVTDRDICMATYTRGQLLADIPVWSTMSTQVTFATPETTLSDVLALMRQAQVRRVPIVDSGRLVGVLSLSDIALYLDVNEGATVGAVELGTTLAAISTPRVSRGPKTVE
jgi:CBS domain-containing protein